MGIAYSITIFDVLGRPMRTLNGLSSGNIESVKWDRRDERDIRVNAGIYIYQFESNHTSTTGKIVVR
jgi:hypothetical protein